MSISFQITLFKELIEKYDTWERLQTYLESEEGGLFRVVDQDNGLCLIRYEKGQSNMNLPHSKWFRCVVWNTIRNRPVCVAPCKTNSEDIPYRTFKELEEAGIVSQENVEGFMINCFRMREDPSLHITSRSKLNAAGTFYSKKSFRELFIESYFNTFSVNQPSEETIQEDTSIISKPEETKKELSIFYSFLVQHTEHKIVKNILTNRVYVIYKGTVYDDGTISIEDTPCPDGIDNIDNIVLPSSKQKTRSYADILINSLKQENVGKSEVEEWAKKYLAEKPRDYQGIVFKDRTGNRWRIRSEKYSAIRSLRGNHPSIRDRFAQLYTSNLLNKYLEYYPEEAWSMSIYSLHVDAIISAIYHFYIDLHIKKCVRLETIDKMFHSHLYNLHGLYLSQLRPAGKNMSQHDIKVYLHKQPWQRLSFLIKKITQPTSTNE